MVLPHPSTNGWARKSCIYSDEKETRLGILSSPIPLLILTTDHNQPLILHKTVYSGEEGRLAMQPQIGIPPPQGNGWMMKKLIARGRTRRVLSSTKPSDDHDGVLRQTTQCLGRNGNEVYPCRTASCITCYNQL